MPPRRVTIAVINYNYERFVGAAIDSALAQDHPDVEVIVVDDGSADGSLDRIRGYGDQVKLVAKENGGQASAMNAAVEAATGEVLIFLDADDVLEPGIASRVAPLFEEGVAWVMYRLELLDEEGVPSGRVRPNRLGVMPDGDLRDHLRRFRCFHWQPTSGNAFAVSALRKVVPIPEEEYRISADAYLAGVMPLCGEVRSVDDVGGGYRVHQASHFTAVAVDATYFRSQIERQTATHAHAVEVGRELGVALPADVRTARDAAFIGFRLASLLLDPEHHPFPRDRRWRLVTSGIVAALANPHLSWQNRLRRTAYFLACGILPRDAAARHAERSAPDTPARRAQFLPARGGQL